MNRALGVIFVILLPVAGCGGSGSPEQKPEGGAKAEAPKSAAQAVAAAPKVDAGPSAEAKPPAKNQSIAPTKAEIEAALAAAVKPEAPGKPMTCNKEPCTDESCLGEEEALKLKAEPAAPAPPFEVEAVSGRIADGRWLVLYSRRWTRPYFEGGAFRVSAITTDEAGALRVEKTVELPKQEQREKLAGGSVEIRDLDADGAEEALVVYESGDWNGEFCVGGPDEYERAAVLRLPGLEVAWKAVLSDRGYEIGRPRTGKLRFEDRNRDGHPDAVIDVRLGVDWDCETNPGDCDLEGKDKEKKSTEVYFYDSVSDAWKKR